MRLNKYLKINYSLNTYYLRINYQLKSAMFIPVVIKNLILDFARNRNRIEIHTCIFEHLYPYILNNPNTKIKELLHIERQIFIDIELNLEEEARIMYPQCKIIKALFNYKGHDLIVFEDVWVYMEQDEVYF